MRAGVSKSYRKKDVADEESRVVPGFSHFAFAGVISFAASSGGGNLTSAGLTSAAGAGAAGTGAAGAGTNVTTVLMVRALISSW